MQNTTYNYLYFWARATFTCSVQEQWVPYQHEGLVLKKILAVTKLELGTMFDSRKNGAKNLFSIQTIDETTEMYRYGLILRRRLIHGRIRKDKDEIGC